MSTVRIPPVLRTNVGGAKQVDVPGSTVGEVIEGLVGSYPALRGQLLTEDGQLNRFVNVYLNDQDVRYLQERATPVDERDTIIILPAMAGGASGGHPGRAAGLSGRRTALRVSPDSDPGATGVANARSCRFAAAAAVVGLDPEADPTQAVLR